MVRTRFALWSFGSFFSTVQLGEGFSRSGWPCQPSSHVFPTFTNTHWQFPTHSLSIFQMWISLNQFPNAQPDRNKINKTLRRSKPHSWHTAAWAAPRHSAAILDGAWKFDGPIIAGRLVYLASTKCAMIQCWKLLWHLRSVWDKWMPPHKFPKLLLPWLFSICQEPTSKQRRKSPWFPGFCSLIAYYINAV